MSTTTTTTTTTTAPAGTSFTLTSTPAVVETSLNYFTPPVDGSKPWIGINSDPTSTARPRNWDSKAFPAEITNLRGKEETASLDTTGFEFLQSATAERAFVDSEAALQDYYNETIDLLKRTTGAEKAVIFDHTIRRRLLVPTPDTPTTRQPVPQVHVDQTPESALARVFRHLPKEEAEVRSKRRFMIINIWRPIAHAAWDMPLALADGRTVKQENLVPTTLRYPDRDGETYSIAYSAGYKWYYVRGLKTDEVALIKCYDSNPVEGGSTFTPHTAFVDPTTPEGAKPRQSIELRALVFF